MIWSIMWWALSSILMTGVLDEESLQDLKVLDGTLEWVVGGGSTVKLTEAEHGDWRWIPRTTMADLYEQMRVWCASINEARLLIRKD